MADDMFPGRDRTGQRNHADLLVPGERVADRFPATKQHVQNARREDIFCQLCQLQRGQGRDLRGLNHHAVPCRQRGGQLPGGHHQRVVPRRDRGHHAHRIAANHRRVAVKVLARCQTVQAAGGPGKETENVDHRRNFIPQRAVQRLAAVEGLEPGKRLTVRFNRIRQLQQALGAGFRRRLSPRRKSTVSRQHRRGDLGR